MTEALKRTPLPDGKTFDALPHVAAFLQAARGYDDEIPTHYPRITEAPDPAGKNYEWFVDNEREPRGRQIRVTRARRSNRAEPSPDQTGVAPESVTLSE